MSGRHEQPTGHLSPTLRTCPWCGNLDDCQPGQPGTSGHHTLCCVDRYNPRCMAPAPKATDDPGPGYVAERGFVVGGLEARQLARMAEDRDIHAMHDAQQEAADRVYMRARRARLAREAEAGDES